MNRKVPSRASGFALLDALMASVAFSLVWAQMMQQWADLNRHLLLSEVQWEAEQVAQAWVVQEWAMPVAQRQDRRTVTGRTDRFELTVSRSSRRSDGFPRGGSHWCLRVQAANNTEITSHYCGYSAPHGRIY